MITRLYVNNFRCLVAFEAEFESFAVLFGPNGGGKSSVFDALRAVRDVATGDRSIDSAMPFSEHTKWLDGKVMEFELGMMEQGRRFLYRLHVEQVSGTVRPRVVREDASCDGKTLFQRDLDGVRLIKAGGAEAGFPLDWRQAALGAVQPATDRQEIETLQEAVARLLVLRPNPLAQVDEPESKEEASRPLLSLANVTSWYRFLAQEQEWTDSLRDALRTVWPDFRAFRLVGTGPQAKALQLLFGDDGAREPGALFYHQLSDGERMLVGLYMVRSAIETGAAHTVLIDEPDNFVGLPELQPWLLSLMELLGDDRQAILISHHPEILNTAGGQYGLHLWRDNHTSPTRIGRLQPPEGLSPGEAVTRGWVHA
ncbi:MAG TPA: hypothetical protein VLH79_13375 [Chthonomonadales bacterium]|nr:hypothetical protein [Chthonomonadales bacterium]